MANHSPRCIENALGAIAENNATTLHYALGTEADLTPETDDEALEWLANGNALCRHYDGCPTCPGCDDCDGPATAAASIASGTAAANTFPSNTAVAAAASIASGTAAATGHAALFDGPAAAPIETSTAAVRLTRSREVAGTYLTPAVPVYGVLEVRPVETESGRREGYTVSAPDHRREFGGMHRTLTDVRATVAGLLAGGN